jgi:quaternary ammonium compound-resistance protein SugE
MKMCTKRFSSEIKQNGDLPMTGLAWTYLLVAGVFEIGWPVGLKMAQTPGKTAVGVILAAACMAVSGFLLYLAQRHIPMGTAYAVWTGIGAAGTFVVGIFLYNDPVGAMRLFAVLLIISGVILLKMAH